VYSKPPFGGPAYVLQYLGRYTHRIAISNHRLVSFVEGKVTFRWRDSAHNNEQKLLTLSLDEFLRRFLLHVLPKSVVRIRNFGFLANRRRATLLPLCFQLLGSVSFSKHLRAPPLYILYYRQPLPILELRRIERETLCYARWSRSHRRDGEINGTC
jgi:Putative transposase